MSERMEDIRRRLGEARLGLEVCRRRLAALRTTLAEGGDAPLISEAARAASGVPLFHSAGSPSGAIQDQELHFEVLDTEDPGREGR
jgi:hypothetical protein